jgi:hypothetical protein
MKEYKEDYYCTSIDGTPWNDVFRPKVVVEENNTMMILRKDLRPEIIITSPHEIQPVAPRKRTREEESENQQQQPKKQRKEANLDFDFWDHMLEIVTDRGNTIAHFAHLAAENTLYIGHRNDAWRQERTLFSALHSYLKILYHMIMDVIKNTNIHPQFSVEIDQDGDARAICNVDGYVFQINL